MNEITLTLYRGLNGTNPSAFRVDEDGVSVFETLLSDYKFNLPIRAVYRDEKVAGTIAEISEPMLQGGLPNTHRNLAQGIGRCAFPVWKNRRARACCQNTQKLCLDKCYEQRC